MHPAPRKRWLGLLAVLLLGPLPAGEDRGQTEAQLRSLTQQIERVQQQVQQDAVERDRLSRALRDAERSVASTRGELSRLRGARGDREVARARLEAERVERQRALDTQRASLVAQLRAAYVLGRTPALQQMLGEADPAAAARRLTYLGYLGRLSAARIAEFEEQLKTIGALEAQIAEDDAELARLEAARRGELEKLERARKARREVLADLERDSRDRNRSLTRLRQQQQALSRVLRDLDRAARAAKASPVNPNDPFARLRGKLGWPVAGTLTARFGQPRAGGVKWTGVMIATEQGAPVRAVHGGRVAYADWLPGLGLLMILDHGNGYLTLYGHNGQLFKGPGVQVSPGETIAAAGDTGGRSRTELYFEIRRNGQPLDPRPWFQRPAP
ncbi:MAG: hypothetical protein RL026_1675 [Pseudomonadota bacterium]|jgi:septal ring factor EnvC (AmiA/AmiB activator)